VDWSSTPSVSGEDERRQNRVATQALPDGRIATKRTNNPQETRRRYERSMLTVAMIAGRTFALFWSGTEYSG
jgi:hypothetical protein